MYNTRTGAIRWQLSDFLYDINSNFGSISHRLRDIRKQEKFQHFDLENEGQTRSGKTGLAPFD